MKSQQLFLNTHDLSTKYLHTTRALASFNYESFVLLNVSRTSREREGNRQSQDYFTRREEQEARAWNLLKFRWVVAWQMNFEATAYPTPPALLALASLIFVDAAKQEFLRFTRVRFLLIEFPVWTPNWRNAYTEFRR